MEEVPGKANAGGAGLAPQNSGVGQGRAAQESPKMHISLHSCKAKLAGRNIWVLAVFIERERKKNPRHSQSNPISTLPLFFFHIEEKTLAVFISFKPIKSATLGCVSIIPCLHFPTNSEFCGNSGAVHTLPGSEQRVNGHKR